MEITGVNRLALESLSARRAWIEIDIVSIERCNLKVALRKESVDRNWVLSDSITPLRGRSPQGERG